MYYSNGFPSTYDELITFYPAYYRNVLELKAILEANGHLCDNVINAINSVIENCFVESADEATITRLEKFLGIVTDASRPLEERRRLVYSYFVGFGKISASKLKEAIKAFTGADSKITFERTDEAGNNTLLIEIERGKNAELSYTDIETAIAKRIPAHIAYQLSFKYSHTVVAAKATTNRYTSDYIPCGTTVAGVI